MRTLKLTIGLVCGLTLHAISQDLSKSVLPAPTLSQDYQFNQIKNDLFNLGLSYFEYKNYKDIQGSPYLNAELSDGKIITNENKVLVGKLRYNVYKDEIEFEYKNNLLSIAKPDNFKEFFIGEQKLKYVDYVVAKKAKKTFMLVLTEGEFSLLVKKTVEYFNKEKQQPYSVPKPDRFESREDTYYLSYQNSPAHKITSAKKLFKAFPDIKNIVNSYSEKKVNYNNKEELIQLVEYLNNQYAKK